MFSGLYDFQIKAERIIKKYLCLSLTDETEINITNEICELLEKNQQLKKYLDDLQLLEFVREEYPDILKIKFNLPDSVGHFMIYGD